MVGPNHQSVAGERVSFFSGNTFGDCICGVFRAGNRQSDFGAGDHGMGGVRATGAGAGVEGEGTGICAGGALAGSFARENSGETPAAEYSATCLDSSDDRHGGRDSGGVDVEFSWAGSASADTKLGSDAERRTRALVRRATHGALSRAGGDDGGAGVQF